MKPVAYALALASLLAVATANAAPAPSRYRGTITAITPTSVTVHTRAGEDRIFAIGTDTHYVTVHQAALSDIKADDFIGTATKNIGSALIALEVTIFPAALRGAGEGHYAWDKLPDTTLNAAAATDSAMTNGNVKLVQQPMAQPVASAMTNGAVSSTQKTDGAAELTVTYKGGKQTIIVPPTAPVVRLKVGAASDLAEGAAVFVMATAAGSTLNADLIAIGTDGTVPPM